MSVKNVRQARRIQKGMTYYAVTHLLQLATKEGISTTLSESLFGGDEEQPDDRKLIGEFLFFAKETQTMLIAIETNNVEMREIYN